MWLIYLALMYVLPFIAVWRSVRSRMRGDARAHWATRLLLGLLSFILCSLFFLFSLHMCLRGQPELQWLVVAVACLFVLCVAPNPRVRALVGLPFLGLLTGQLYNGIVHSEGWTGNPSRSKGTVEAVWHTPLTGVYREVLPEDGLQHSPPQR